MKNLFYLFCAIILFSCSQPKEKSNQEIKTEKKEIEQVDESKFKVDSLGMKKKSAGSESLSCDCTCDCDGKLFTATVFPCKNKEKACEKACKQKCK